MAPNSAPATSSGLLDALSPPPSPPARGVHVRARAPAVARVRLRAQTPPARPPARPELVRAAATAPSTPRRRASIRSPGVEDVQGPIDLIEIRALRAKFAELDTDRNGVIDRDEFRTLFAAVVQLPEGGCGGVAREGLLDFAYELFDGSGSSSLHLRDFVAGCVVLGRGSETERLRYLFQMYDQDRSGGLCMPELERVFGVMRSYAVARAAAEECGGDVAAAAAESARLKENATFSAKDLAEKAMREHDLDQDGQLGFEEFRRWCAEEPDTKAWLDILCEDTAKGMDRLREERERSMLVVELANMGFGDDRTYHDGFSLVEGAAAGSATALSADCDAGAPPLSDVPAASEGETASPPQGASSSTLGEAASRVGSTPYGTPRLGASAGGPLSPLSQSRQTLESEAASRSQSSAQSASGARSEAALYDVQRSESGRPGAFEIDFSSLELVSQIGEGSFARVWRGKWLDIDVAVKILKSGPQLPPSAATGSRSAAERAGISFGESLEPELASGFDGAAPGIGGSMAGGAEEGAAQNSMRVRDRHHFLREIGLLTNLRHPNVLLLMGACTDPRYPLCIVSQLVEGGSLHSYLHGRNAGRLSSRHALRLALHIARGMLYLHASMPIVLHRDLKSANILVEGMDEEDSSKAIIIDFGLSRLDSTTDSRVGGAAGMCGSLITMAPEVMRNEMYQPGSDVYSFGIILGEMFSGRIPFGNANALQLMYAVGIEGKRPVFTDADGIPAPVTELMHRCWAQDPRQRPDFKTVVETLNTIHTVLESEIGSSTSSSG